jgi:hypothetical protein
LTVFVPQTTEALDPQHAFGTKRVSHFPSETSLAAVSNGLWPQYSFVVIIFIKKVKFSFIFQFLTGLNICGGLNIYGHSNEKLGYS